ncbi:hypothetical protein D3X11_06970 [Streptococcus sp. X16XC17]|uniref:competence type IV pilus minor pilin ComGG n=1 Tax=unclassified Streptococcus TaxID=2608887 RepID=UPI00066FC67F|nr:MULTISPECIES: competence type IV pilus minor pilin ComGG [unclassified Streptococcus]TCD45514.1 hypothetical protein D3X11_06970 [Streptococcus sp. X16XC17]
MILQKRLKAGILLYALLMLSIFTLFLQFYLQTQIARAHNSRALKESSQAYVMALWTVEDLTKSPISKVEEVSEKPNMSSKTTSASNIPRKQEETPLTNHVSLSGSQSFTDGEVTYMEKG